MKYSIKCALLCAITLFLSDRAEAQVAAGTISITVTDASGAMVPGAAITVTNSGTGLIRSGIANEHGELSVQFLPVGQYSISVQIAGFKKTTIEQVVLQVDQTASIRITLQPGEVHEMVEVSGIAASLDGETSSLGQVIENKKILGTSAQRPECLLRSVCSPATRHPCSAWGRIFRSSPGAADFRQTRSRSTEWITTPCPMEARSDGMASR